MAEPVLTLDAAQVSVDPGGQARVTVTITNTGTIVEGYAVDVVGDPAPWSEVLPAEVSIYPQQSATAEIIFSPPAGSAAPSGTLAFGVRARSVVDPEASAVAEGDITVAAVLGLQAEITPETSTGRWRGRHTVEFSNWGNAAARLRVIASDPDEALGFLVRPDLVDVPLGGKAKARVIVRTRKPFLRGNPVRLPFQVVGEREDAEPQTGPTQPYADPGRPAVDAALNQKPILSRMVVIVGALALAAIIAGGVWAWTRPDPVETFQELGTPPTPELTAEAVDHDTVRLRWQPIQQIQGYKVLIIDPETSATSGVKQISADQDQDVVDGLAAEAQHCFQLQAVRGNLQSPRSAQACAITAAAPASATPSAPASAPASSAAGQATSAPPSTAASAPPNGGSATSAAPSTAPSAPASAPSATSTSETITEGQWVAVAGLFGGPASLDAPEALVDALALAGLEGKIIDSTQYPEMPMVTTQSWVVYVGPYATQQEAAQTCQLVEQVDRPAPQPCIPLQPDPVP